MSTIENSGANRAYRPPDDVHLIAGQLLAGKPALLADLEAEARQAHKELVDDSAADWSVCAHVPILFTVAVAGIGARPHAVPVADHLVSFTVAGRHIHDPQAIAVLWDRFQHVVTSTRITRPHEARIEPGLPAPLASAHWRTERGDVTLNRPRPASRRKPRRLWALGAPLLGWWASVHGKIPAGFGPVGAAAGVIAVASVTAGAAPAAPAPPQHSTIREVYVPPRTRLSASAAPRPDPAPTPHRTRNTPRPAIVASSRTAAHTKEPAASPGTRPASPAPTSTVPTPVIGATITGHCVTVTVLGVTATTCRHS